MLTVRRQRLEQPRSVQLLEHPAAPLAAQLQGVLLHATRPLITKHKKFNI
jgi:hypothetical protein